MIEIQGEYAKAKVFTDKLEPTAQSQIESLCNQSFAKDAQIRIMPDVHSGKGCVIGLTMTVKDKIVPNLVGVDLGCGISGVKLQERLIDFEKLEQVIRQNVPAGFSVRNHIHKLAHDLPLDDLKCMSAIDKDRALKSIGTLGGGNHFLEAGRDKDHHIWLFVHSGSRQLGSQIHKHYQDKALQNLKNQGIKITDKDLAYIEGQDLEDYLHDVNIAQLYALTNREAMLETIIDGLKATPAEPIVHTIHNYIDVDNLIIRKGAIRSFQDEIVLIPMNMRDGMLIARGKGNPDWNYSAPHGAGRIMSRTQARRAVSLQDFQDSMAGIWTKSAVKSTVDESPMVYKPMDEILSHIQDTVDVLDIVKPIYNFKATR